LEKKVGFGIIGTGNIAKFHADCIEKINNANLLGVVSKSESRANEVRQLYNCSVFSDMESLLEIPEIDLVCVCNESGLHGETIARIAKAGKNILCEKPLETTIVKIDQIAEVVKSSGIKLGCVFQNRENPEYIKFKNYIDSGLLGKILLCQTTINWYRPPSYYEDSWRGSISMDGGAALINQGIHTVDLMLDLMGNVSELSGFIDTVYHDIEGEDLGVASLKFKSGALGTLSVGTSLLPGEPESITIYGSLGNISFNGGKINSSSIESINNQLNANNNDLGSGASDPMAIGDQFHISTIENMIDVILKKCKPRVDINEAKKSVALINAIYRSKGNKIKLN
jgi:predicted dehydrogenase